MATIVDVARAAGVSAMTVSRALHQPGVVHPDTRARVLAVVEAMGYVPNAAARSLVRGSTETIALIVSDISNPFFTTVVRGAEDVAQEYGYTLMLGNTDEKPDKERRYVDVLSSRRVDGVILSPTGEDHVHLLQDRGIPIVLIDRQIRGVDADAVVNDGYDGGRQIIAHLVEQGYRRIAFVGGPAGVSSLTERVAGCQQAAGEAGLSLSIHLGQYSRTSGEEIVETLHAEGLLPEAIIAANNLVALGALAALRRHGLRVPEDVGLAGFGEIELAALVDPFLTVVREPAYEIGQVGMRMLHERISGLEHAPRLQVLPVELVARRSTLRVR